MQDYLDVLDTETLAHGVRVDGAGGSFTCLTCGRVFEQGEVYPEQGRFFTAERAALRHAAQAHGGRLEQLLAGDSRYVTLTDNQKTLLRLLARGKSDAEIARQTGTAPATVRRQRFAFREKARQAKLYLAIYRLAMAGGGQAKEALVPLLADVPKEDERFLITAEEYARFVQNAFSSTKPLRLRALPAKEKRKVAVLNEIAGLFEPGRQYTEKEVNGILKAVHPEEYVTLRRYLIEYGFMQRLRDGSRYWMTQTGPATGGRQADDI